MSDEQNKYQENYKSNVLTDKHFSHVLNIIQEGKYKAINSVNKVLIETYFRVGAYLSKQVNSNNWGKSVVSELSKRLKSQYPELQGYSVQNLWRMKQIYELYQDDSKLSPLVREIPWTHNCVIMAQCKTSEEREFYLKNTISARWSKRELEKQIRSGNFERTMIADKKLSPVVRELPQDVSGVFKDSYTVDFLELSSTFLEKDLQAGLVANLRKFLLELGSGFAFIGEKVRIQVGNKDFELDLLFYHRDLQCLVAFELKTGDFEPAQIGQLSFYLEALDKQNKREHENPTIGVLLCKSKDEEVVELALNTSMSPALVSEYKTKMIPKELLKKKLLEWSSDIENGDFEGGEDE